MRDAKTAAKLDENEHDRQHEEGADRIEGHSGRATIANELNRTRESTQK
jgi:hypothetical protein